MSNEDFTYEEWVRNEKKPSIYLDHPVIGAIGLHVSKDAYTAAVADKEIAFSPLEVKELFMGHDAGLIDQESVAAVCRVKKSFPGARVVSVQEPEACVLCGKMFVVAVSGEKDGRPSEPVCIDCHIGRNRI